MVSLSWIARSRLLAAAGLTALTLGACTDYVGKIPKHLAPLEASTKALIEKKGMEQKAPILIRVFKEESTLEIWKQQKATGRYALMKDYEICKWSGVLGPKLKEGDRQAPEGFYTIRPAQMNPNSSYHLSFNMGFPNEYDRAHGRTGTHLMVHGACSSAGCYSMTDEQIQEIYTLGRLAFEGGQRDFQVQAFPFRMTAENMARHRDNPNMPFWRMLKEGYDHFELIKQPPKVDVCDRRYVFNAVAKDGGSFNPTEACPPLMMPDEIRVALGESDSKSDPKMLELAAKLDRKEGKNAAALLAQALAEPTTVAMAAPMSVADSLISLEPTATASIAGAEKPSVGNLAPSTPPTVGNSVSPAELEPSTAPAAVANISPAKSEAPSTGGSTASLSLAPVAPPPAEGATLQPARAESGSQTGKVGGATASPAASGLSEGAATPPARTVPPELFSPTPTFSTAGQTDTASVSPTQLPAPIAAPAAPAQTGSAPKPPTEVAASATVPEPESATLDERMQAAPTNGGSANAYAPEAEENGGLTGFVLKLFE